jgi:hypothetical protein
LPLVCLAADDHLSDPDSWTLEVHPGVAMKIKTKVKAGAISINHNVTVRRVKSMKRSRRVQRA